MKTVTKGGEYFRVCDPTWDDPCDSTFSEQIGGRWNAPQSFPVLYLNADIDTARANALRNFEGEAFGLFDLNPTARPHLQVVDIAKRQVADAISSDGLVQLGLPDTYPAGIGRDICQPIGQTVFDANVAGIACRSAALPVGEELALIDQSAVKSLRKRHTFDEWFTSAPMP